jgi:hypothetical protein
MKSILNQFFNKYNQDTIYIESYEEFVSSWKISYRQLKSQGVHALTTKKLYQLITLC